MKTINKKYFRYLIRQNKRFLLLIWLISFILIPFFTITFLNNDNWYNFGHIAIITSFFGFLISIIVPVYLFAFLQNKQSNILYFSLPIKKESLFITTSCFALFGTVIPVAVNYLLAILIKNFFLPASLGSQLFSVILLMIYMVCIQAVITVIILLCQNLLDSFLVSFAYMLVPLLFYGCYMTYLSSLGNHFMMGTGNYAAVFDPLLGYISMIYSGVIQITACIDNTALIDLVQIMYWLIIAIGFNSIAYWLFKRRKLEQSENHTRSIFIYPVLITIIIFSLMLTIYNSDFDATTIAFYIVIFIFYLLMYFFAIRRVRLTWKMPVIFITLIICCMGFANAFENTTGFRMMSEYPVISQQQSFNMSFRVSEPIIYHDQNVDYLTIDSKNKNTLKLMYEFHQQLIDDQIVTPFYQTGMDVYTPTIDIIYTSDNSVTYRTYQLTKQQQIDQYIELYDEFLETVASDPQYTCHHSEELISQ